MKRINSLSDLLMEELADLLNTESQLIGVYPKMVQASQLSALKVLLENHLEVTKDQAHRLSDIFGNIGQNPQRVTSITIKGIIVDNEIIINETQKSRERDVAIISMAQQMTQYKINGYQIACEHAADLGHTKIVELLNETLEEERVMNLYLNELVQYTINARAIEGIRCL